MCFVNYSSAAQSSRHAITLPRLEHDHEMFRVTPLMSERTIRIPDQGGWQRGRGNDSAGTAALSHVAVEQKFNAD